MLYGIRFERPTGFRFSSNNFRTELARARCLGLDTIGHARGTCGVAPILGVRIRHSRRLFATTDISVSDHWRPAGRTRPLPGVEALGLEILRCVPDGPTEARLDRAALSEALELMAVNAVRGFVPILELEGRPVGDGRPEPTCSRIAGAFGRP